MLNKLLNMKKLFIIIFLLFPMLARANVDDDYTITNLRISKIDKDATTARQKAMNQGQREAFNTILNRLGVDDSNGIVVSDDEISQMLRSMQIKSERITNNSYSATITMEFSPEYVKYILNKYKISKFSPKLNSYLIVPVLGENDEIYLWEKNNRWMNAFKKNIRTTKNILLVDDDYSTKNLIDLDYFQKPTFSKFRDIADLYNVNNIVVVTGNYRKGGDIIATKIYILNQNKSKVATMNYEIENLNNVNLDFNNAAIKIIEYINDLNNRENEDNNADNVAAIPEGYIYIFAPISSLRDYNNINNILNSNKNIVNIELKMLSKNMAVYSVLYHNNDLESLIDSLKNDGFSVSKKKNGLYIFL